MRFLLGFNGIYYPYKTTLPDIISKPGLINLVLEEDSILPEDDVVNGIAYNPTNPVTPTNLSIFGSDNIKINQQSAYNIINNPNNYTFTWSLNNAYASIVSNTGITCTVKAGGTMGKQSILTAICVQDGTIVLTKTISTISAF
jgi:hypothetical protein